MTQVLHFLSGTILGMYIAQEYKDHVPNVKVTIRNALDNLKDNKPSK